MKVSVTMATYNGEKYLKQQIESIVPQLQDKDELIISDDASSDNTLRIISLYRYPNIKVYKNTNRKGIVKNFENAIIQSKGNIIVLADQDDIWESNKLEIIRHYFKKTTCNVLISDAFIINEKGNVIHNSFYEFRRSGPGFFKNIYKNTYIGCCMAFRSSLKSIILPIPENIPMHDMWIGLLGEIFSKTLFIEDKLIYYRIHKYNNTRLNKSNPRKYLIWRFNLITNLFKRYLIIRFGGKKNGCNYFYSYM